MGREWNSSYQPRHAPLDLCPALQRLYAGCLGAVFRSPFGQVRSLNGKCPWHLRTSNFTLVFPAEHNIPDAPPSTNAGCGWCPSAVSFVSAMPRFHSSSAPWCDGRRSESQNYGYRFGPREETYNIVAGPRLLRRPDLPVRLFPTTAASLHFLLATWPVVAIWFTARREHDGLQLNGFKLPKQSICDGQGRRDHILG